MIALRASGFCSTVRSVSERNDEQNLRARCLLPTRRFKTLAAKLLRGVVIAFVVPIGWPATGRGEGTAPEVVSAPMVPAERVIRLAKARAALARLWRRRRRTVGSALEPISDVATELSRVAAPALRSR